MKAPAPTKRGQSVTKKIPNPVDRHVGSRVRMRRLMLGISQTKLGEKLGLTFQQVQKYEKGTRACLQLGGLCTRTDQNQTRNTVLFCSAPVRWGFPNQLSSD